MSDSLAHADELAARLLSAVNRGRSSEAGLYGLLTTGEASPDPADDDGLPRTPDGTRHLAVDPTQGHGAREPRPGDPMLEAFRAVGLA